MAKIRNVSGNDLIVPSLAGRLVVAGQVVEVEAADVHAFTIQASNWAPADKAAQAAHDKATPAPDAPEAVTSKES